jgi:2-polyprenyl-3-methyl-5-hydroxy-6-metoxy-1,4-benzoquinol methylase
LILDIGCGFGQTLSGLRDFGYVNLFGIDVDQNAVQFCLKKKLAVELIYDIKIYAKNSEKKFDFIIMSHVIEHLEKQHIITTLRDIRKNLLNQNGTMFIAVPNAQSNTGSYWAFEDFTHSTIFTSGSIYYVLKSAGFEIINFIDIDCTAGMPWYKKMLKITALKLFKLKRKLENYATSSSYHKSSPDIFSYEIKIMVS